MDTRYQAQARRSVKGQTYTHCKAQWVRGRCTGGTGLASVRATVPVYWPRLGAGGYGLRVRLASRLHTGSGVARQVACQARVEAGAAGPRALGVTPSATRHLTRSARCACGFGFGVTWRLALFPWAGWVDEGAASIGGGDKGTRTRNVVSNETQRETKDPITANGEESPGPIATPSDPLGRSRGRVTQSPYITTLSTRFHDGSLLSRVLPDMGPSTRSNKS